jgi:signal transduction histidine kinase
MATQRLDPEAWAFAVLRALALAGALVALLLVPLRPEHTQHLPPLIIAFILYKVLFFLLLVRHPGASRPLFIGTAILDLALAFFLVWFTGGPESHFYLLFYLLIALHATFFGFPGGLGTALGGSLLYVLADLFSQAHLHYGNLAARIAVFGLLGIPLGFLADRERRARAEAERLNRELLEKQQQLVQAEKLATVGKMAAKVAHEIRNPLGSISLNLELLEDELRSPGSESGEEGQRLVGAIQGQVDTLNAVVEEYLRFARLPAPKMEVVQVEDLLRDLLVFLREETEDRGITVKLDVSEEIPPVQADPRQLRQALLNLVRNACEAMPAGGTLTVSARQGKKGIETILADTGPGIPAEDLPRIFEPFFTTKAEGTGLGLAIARQIALAHGGDLACESAPGAGATFILQLPLRRSETP